MSPRHVTWSDPANITQRARNDLSCFGNVTADDTEMSAALRRLAQDADQPGFLWRTATASGRSRRFSLHFGISWSQRYENWMSNSRVCRLHRSGAAVYSAWSSVLALQKAKWSIKRAGRKRMICVPQARGQIAHQTWPKKIFIKAIYKQTHS